MRLDGAGDWVVLRRLIVPLLSPTILFVAISTVVFTIQQVFTPIDVMTQGGPLNSTTNLFYLVYQYMFESFNVGYSAAGALLIFLLLGLIIAAKMIWFEKLVHYS
jgi:multiple sugar transport system permease protein/sn-glycerol 3-phosphate transport system permease protein